MAVLIKGESMKLDIREMYMPGHFGNSYDVMGEFEMAEKLKESVYWGFNAYSDWFDSAGLTAPFNEAPHCGNSLIIWQRKKAFYRSAADSGLRIGLCVTPNHVFADQVTEKNKAKKGEKLFGQLVCPSTKSGENIILGNYEWFFKDLKKDGIELDFLTLGPYDYGGCACDKCAPWITTFAGLSVKIHKLAKKYHGKVMLDFVGWWWDPKEHELFKEWMEKKHPGLARGMSLHILYEKNEPINAVLPQGCGRRAFIHAGYPEKVKIEGIFDRYSMMGPVVAPKRIQNTIEGLVRSKSEGFMVYSEGMYEDANHALIGALSSGKAVTSGEALIEYAKRYYKVSGRDAKLWADFLLCFGDWTDIDIEGAAKQYKYLSSVSEPGWRLEQWGEKIKLIRLNRRISTMKGWGPVRLKLVDEWHKTLEDTRRGVYALGVQRHIFVPQFCGADWHKEWMALGKKSANRISKEA